MPILDVEIVTAEGEAWPPGLAAALADAAGAALDARPGGTWVKLRKLRAERYAESGGGPPPGVRPIFVRVLLARRPPPEELRASAAALAEAIGAACGRPTENVHVAFEEDGVGRVAFGGRLLEE